MTKKIVSFVMLLLFVTALHSATYYLDDDGSGDGSSWVEAAASWADLLDTWTLQDGDIINVAVGTYIRSSEIVISNSLTIIAGQENPEWYDPATETIFQVTTPGVTNSRVFNINALGKTVNINNMIIKGGNTPSNNGACVYINDGAVNFENVTATLGKGMDGSGILVGANSDGVILTNCTISNNQGIHADSDGGGICVLGGAGTTTLTNCTVENNTSQSDGGGITVQGNAGIVTITNSTINNNTSGDRAGGIGGDASTTINITNSTIYGNQANDIAGGVGSLGVLSLKNVSITDNNSDYLGLGSNKVGGGLFFQGSSLTCKNTIIANNVRGASGSTTADDAYIVSVSVTEDHNIVEVPGGSHTWSGTGDITGNQANLFGTGQATQTLADNGGPTQTLAIENGSVAIGAGDWDASITTDQRGEDRADYPTIGSYEFTSSIIFADGSAYSPSPILGETDQPIGRFSIYADISGSMLKEASITLNGTRSGISNFKLWVSSDATFGSDVQLGTTIASDPGDGGTLDFSGFTSDIATSAEYYFLTCDVSSEATGSVQAALVDDSYLGFGGGILSSGFSNAPLSNGSVTLPVELSVFTAQYIENTPTIHWSTQSETDNMGWLLYRNDRNDFPSSEVISDMIEGHGTTAEQQFYTYEDDLQDAEVGDTYYYWLESVDYSGIINHYDRVAILTIPEHNDPGNNGITEPEQFGLFQNNPNPVISSTRISFNLKESAKVDLAIYNLKGQLVKNLYFGTSSKHTIMWEGKDENGKQLKNGVYLYKLLINGKTKETKKLILMK